MNKFNVGMIEDKIEVTFFETLKVKPVKLEGSDAKMYKAVDPNGLIVFVGKDTEMVDYLNWYFFKQDKS